MELKFILESVLFSAQHPLSPKELRDVLVTAAQQTEDASVRAFKKITPEAITAALEQLQPEIEQAQRTFRLACVAGAWQFVSHPEYAPWIKALVGHKARPPRLSQPALETLAIIAYRQPLTRAEIEQVRGVTVDGVMQTLLERGLIEAVGRAEVPGRPMTYGTTQLFLQYFGLGTLEDLPAADELRKVPVAKPDALLTVDAGLATAPPEQLVLGERANIPAEPGDGRSPSPASPETSAPPAPPADTSSSVERAPQPAMESSSVAAAPEELTAPGDPSPAPLRRPRSRTRNPESP